MFELLKQELAKVDIAEKRILTFALAFIGTQLLLVTVAVAFLGIDVPTCQPNEKLFDKGSVRTVGPKRYEVHFVAKMWAFEPRSITIPTGSTIDFFLGSPDVNHGFHINKTNINLLAVPGVINKATHTFHQPGKYHIICHEYCGLGHQNMNGVINVSDTATEISSDLSSSLSSPGPSTTEGGAVTEAAALGKTLYEQRGCIACHSLDGSLRVGPTFRGLWNRTEELQDGSVIQVDEAYLVESIQDPFAKIVKGFGATMPPTPLTKEEVKNLIEFIKSLQ